MPGLTVTSVRSWGDLREFVALPYRLHAGTPWVPPLKLERYLFLSRRANAYFKHGRAQYLLARRDGSVAGRISVQVDDAFNAFHGERTAMFGFLEFEDDADVLAALLQAAREWARSQGCERLLGPMDFSLNDESGVLIEGFELAPLIRQPWHPPYYQQRCEQAGLTKAMDLYSWRLDVSERSSVRPALWRIAERAREHHGITIRPMTRAHLRRDLDAFADIYNAAWAGNWGFVPYGKADLDAYALDLQLVYSPGWFMVAELHGEPIAMAISVLDINQVLKRMNGRLLPLGWWHFLRKGKIIDRVRVGFLGVKPEYQHTGVAAKLYIEHFDMAAITPQTWGEMGWILETNHNMNRAMEAMGGRVVRRFRVYERALAST
jgi:GNAT superfamily N-acetyltransferase